jgi:hypothetical protein
VVELSRSHKPEPPPKLRTTSPACHHQNPADSRESSRSKRHWSRWGRPSHRLLRGSVGEPGRSKVGTAVESCEEELRLAIHASDLAHNFHKTTEQIAQAALGHIDPITLGYAHSVRAIGEGIGLLTLIDANVWQLPFEIILVPLQATLSDAYLGETPASNEP